MLTVIVGLDRLTTVAATIDGDDRRRNANDDDLRAALELRTGVVHPKKSMVTSASGSRIETGTVNGTEIANVDGIGIGSKIAMVDVGIVPVRTVLADPDLIQGLLLNVESHRSDVREVLTENVAHAVDPSRSMIEDMVNTVRIEERNVAMNIVANTETTERDHRDITLIIKAIAAAEVTTEVVHVVVAATETVAISRTSLGAMIVATRKDHQCRRLNTISTATQWDRECQMSTIIMTRYTTATVCPRVWSERAIYHRTVFLRQDIIRHRPSRRCLPVQLVQTGILRGKLPVLTLDILGNRMQWPTTNSHRSRFQFNNRHLKSTRNLPHQVSKNKIIGLVNKKPNTELLPQQLQ